MFQLCVVATFVSQQNIAKGNCHYEAAPTQYTQTQNEEMESIAEVRQNTCCGQCIFEWKKSLRLIVIRKMNFKSWNNFLNDLKLFKKGKKDEKNGTYSKKPKKFQKIWEKSTFSVTKIQSVFHIYIWNIFCFLLAIKSASFLQYIIFFMLLVNFRSKLAVILIDSNDQRYAWRYCHTEPGSFDCVLWSTLGRQVALPDTHHHHHHLRRRRRRRWRHHHCRMR